LSDSLERLYEQVLVLRCQAGDERAFEELIRRYDVRLRYYVRRLLGADAVADDVMQDVWLTAFRKLPQLRIAEAFSVWLYRVARSHALAELRDRREWVPLADGQVTTELAHAEPEFAPDDAPRMHACLDRLRPEHREVLVLRFIEDMSYEKMAAVIGCPVGTVRSRIHYAKVQLRREMGG
jgi:RNA polymerase sigma-70 factor (ECF subfamily)